MLALFFFLFLFNNITIIIFFITTITTASTRKIAPSISYGYILAVFVFVIFVDNVVAVVVDTADMVVFVY